MAHDVFVSHSSTDKSIADAVVAGLEQKGIRCWVAPRDLTPGISWGQGIAEAIEKSQVMVVIMSEKANQSKQVAREVERAISNDVAVIPLRVQNIDPTGALAYFLASEHWLDAITPPLERHIEKLGSAIESFLERDISDLRSEVPLPDPPLKTHAPLQEQQPSTPQKKFTIPIVIGLVAVGLVCLVTLLIGLIFILPRLINRQPVDTTTESMSELPEHNQSPTPTETPLPTFTETVTPTPTEELTATFTPTITSVSGINLPEGWTEYTSAEFAIGLPNRWEVVDIDQEGMDAMLELLLDFDPTWADMIESMYATGATAPPVFFAMDTQMVGAGYANININKDFLPFAVPLKLLCDEFNVVYPEMGFNILESDCALDINGIPAARYLVEMSIGAFTSTQYQYLFLSGRDFWILNFSAEKIGWSEYQPIFISIAETFTLLD